MIFYNNLNFLNIAPRHVIGIIIIDELIINFKCSNISTKKAPAHNLNNKNQSINIQNLVPSQSTICIIKFLDTLYSTQCYTLKLSIPQSYPQSAPFIIFLDKIYHLNIHPSSGQLFISILKYDWSPYLDLFAVFCTLDQVMEQPDQQCSATQKILQQYQQNIESYIQNVKQVIESNHNSNKPISSNNNNNRPTSNKDNNQPKSKNGIMIQTQNSMVQDYKSDSFQQVLEVKDLSYQNLQRCTQNKIRNNLQQSAQQKITTMNHMPISNTQKNIKKQDRMKLNNKMNQNNKKDRYQQNTNIQVTQQQKEFKLLKEQKHRISELISIFSRQLCQLQEKLILLQNRVKLKQTIQKKCIKLQQMLIQLFQLSQQTNSKIMNLLRNNRNNMIN